ncbi:MAG: sigma factor-like helix-turn-helix DNA-binding protein, partial [Planctomycetota bacterium]
LEKDEQDAIRMIVCEGKSYQHAAEALGVSVTTINNWKHRGIVKLRRLMQDSEPGAGEDEARPAARGRFAREGAECVSTVWTSPRRSRIHAAG